MVCSIKSRSQHLITLIKLLLKQTLFLIYTSKCENPNQLITKTTLQQLSVSRSLFCMCFCVEYLIAHYGVNPYLIFFILPRSSFYLFHLEQHETPNVFCFHNLKTSTLCQKNKFMQFCVFIWTKEKNIFNCCSTMR